MDIIIYYDLIMSSSCKDCKYVDPCYILLREPQYDKCTYPNARYAFCYTERLYSPLNYTCGEDGSRFVRMDNKEKIIKHIKKGILLNMPLLLMIYFVCLFMFILL